MSTEYVEERIQGIRDRAKQQMKALDQSLRAIAADESLSDQGKTTQREQTRASYKAHLRTLRQEEEGLIDGTIKTLERELDAKTGNTSTDIIAFRDAQDRADRIANGTEAQRIMARALRTSDTVLAHAVFRRALEDGWREPIKQFLAEKPGAEDTVNDLERLRHLRDDSLSRTMIYAMTGRG
jgi:hypothetical protein